MPTMPSSSTAARSRLARRAALFMPLLALSLPLAASAQHAHPAAAAGQSAEVPLLDGMGRHHQKVTTASALAQRYFDQGLSLAYAFNHAEAKRAFEQAVRLDPSCAMCHWGIAYVLGPNINAGMDPATSAEALEAARRALALSAQASERERAYIAAMVRRYAPDAAATRAGLDSAYAAAMLDVSRRFPDDADAATLFAEATMNLSPWVYWTKAATPRPGTAEVLEALERAMRLQPDNPGACHFYIHAVEAAFPQRAVACAERLAALMPAAGHIVHMPAHIYLRVGRYNDAIRANEHAVHADESYIRDQRPGAGIYTAGYYPHNYHFLSFAAMLAGRGGMAVEAARSAAAGVPVEIAAVATELQLVTSYPHLMLATFGRWDDVLGAPLPGTELPLARGLAQYARGTAHAAGGRLAEARAARDSVALAGEGLPEQWRNVLSVAADVLAAEIALREGATEEAIARLENAVRVEDGFSYMEPPYWHQPVRHLLGAALLRAGRAREAEARYREDLARFPENVWSLRGLERSLTAQQRLDEAADARARYTKAAAEADIVLTSSRL
ncbi:MAG TPA: hypothetical protein VFZ11_01435 [Gemmatimonadaceae bacterium]